MVFQFTLKDLKNYKDGRERSERFAKTVVLKNKQPVAGLFSSTEYKRLLVLIEYLESLEEKNTAKKIKKSVRGGTHFGYAIP